MTTRRFGVVLVGETGWEQGGTLAEIIVSADAPNAPRVEHGGSSAHEKWSAVQAWLNQWITKPIRVSAAVTVLAGRDAGPADSDSVAAVIAPNDPGRFEAVCGVLMGAEFALPVTQTRVQVRPIEALYPFKCLWKPGEGAAGRNIGWAMMEVFTLYNIAFDLDEWTRHEIGEWLDFLEAMADTTIPSYQEVLHSSAWFTDAPDQYLRLLTRFRPDHLAALPADWQERARELETLDAAEAHAAPLAA